MATTLSGLRSIASRSDGRGRALALIGRGTTGTRRLGSGSVAPTDLTSDLQPDLKPRSRDVTDGLEKHRIARHAPRGRHGRRRLGQAADRRRVSSWNEITPCNLSLDRLAKAAKEGVHAGGGYPLEFGTISVSDGISMGHEGMHFSLVSREVIADSVETVMMAERLDGSVLLAGCDKSLPGMLMAAARLDLAVGVPLRRLDHCPAGSSCRTAPRRTSRSSTRSRRSAPALAGKISRGRRRPRSSGPSVRARAPAAACTPPTPWPRAAEALGMSLPGSAAPPAGRPAPRRLRPPSPARPWSSCSAAGITARDIMTKEAFENAIAVVMALGGSTNAVLHLLAIAHEAEVDLTLDDFNRIGDKVPHLGDLKPFGRYVMNDVDRVGGIPVVMKALLDAGLMHGDA